MIKKILPLMFVTQWVVAAEGEQIPADDITKAAMSLVLLQRSDEAARVLIQFKNISDSQKRRNQKKNNSKGYPCSKCDKVFQKERSWAGHQKVHVIRDYSPVVISKR